MCVRANSVTSYRKSVFRPDVSGRIIFSFFLPVISCTRLVIKLTIDIWPVPIPHLSAGVWNIPLHRSELIGPKGGKPCDGNSDPEDRNTLVVFLRFFHLARRFWNHTCSTQSKRYQSLSLSEKEFSKFPRRKKKIFYIILVICIHVTWIFSYIFAILSFYEWLRRSIDFNDSLKNKTSFPLTFCQWARERKSLSRLLFLKQSILALVYDMIENRIFSIISSPALLCPQ